MASFRWRGGAPAVAQVVSITPANVGIGNTFTATMNGKSITFTATAGTVANVTAGLAALLAASTIPEFAEVTWADATTKITGTAKTAGIPFTVTSSATGGTATNTTATTTSNAGPADAGTIANWETSAGVSATSLPTTGDSMFFQNSTADCLYNLDTFAGTTYAALYVDQSFTGRLGLPRINAIGSYPEYRAQYFKAGFTLLVIGRGAGNGSPRIKIDGQAVNSGVTVFTTGSSAEQGLGAVVWKGTGTNTVEIRGGSVDICPFGGETATISVLSVSANALVRCGEGLTVTTINQTGAASQLAVRSAVTTWLREDGTSAHDGTGTITTLTLGGNGRFLARSTGTYTTVNLRDNAIYDKSQSVAAQTLTTTNVYGNAYINDPLGALIYTNGINFIQRAIGAGNDLGEGINLAVTRL